MDEHGKMNKVFDGANIRDRSGDGGDPIRKESELLTPLRDSDISVDRVFIVDNLKPFPLRPYGGSVDVLGVWSQEQIGKGER
jgi:hypothetical protein